MWAQSSSSKLVRDGMDRRSYDRHLRSLTIIKPTMTIDPPQQPNFVYAKYKDVQRQQQKQAEIQNSNTILVQKMMSQKTGQYHQLDNPVFGRQTLNGVISRRRRDQIIQDNKLIMRKLTETKPTYNTRKILSATNKHLEYMSNISQNARRGVTPHKGSRIDTGPLSSRFSSLSGSSVDILRRGRPDTAY